MRRGDALDRGLEKVETLIDGEWHLPCENMISSSIVPVPQLLSSKPNLSLDLSEDVNTCPRDLMSQRLAIISS